MLSIAIRDTATIDDNGKTPLVLLHGLGGSSQTWAFQFRALARISRIIAWDMPGYGASDGFVRENHRRTLSPYPYAVCHAGRRRRFKRAHRRPVGRRR